MMENDMTGYKNIQRQCGWGEHGMGKVAKMQSWATFDLNVHLQARIDTHPCFTTRAHKNYLLLWEEDTK